MPRSSLTSARHRFVRPSIALGLAAGIVLSTGVAALAATTVESQAVPLAAIAQDAEATLVDARSALGEATTVVAAVEASGLDVGGVDRTIDTTALREAIRGLDDHEVMPLFLLPEATEAATAATARVGAQAAALRSALDAAIAAEKAAEEAAAAAERARVEAEAAAAALAAANTVDGAQATARQIAAEQFGWGDDQFSCLVSLWNRESGWNYQAYNSSSGATGIPQSLPGSKMASAGEDWQTNATTQIRWGLDYISRGYGSPCAAWGHSNATGWY